MRYKHIICVVRYEHHHHDVWKVIMLNVGIIIEREDVYQVPRDLIWCDTIVIENSWCWHLTTHPHLWRCHQRLNHLPRCPPFPPSACRQASSTLRNASSSGRGSRHLGSGLPPPRVICCCYEGWWETRCIYRHTRELDLVVLGQLVTSHLHCPNVYPVVIISVYHC